MTHTPTPWRVGDRSPYVEIWGRMRMNAYPIIASLEGSPREANAEFIVRAVNCHDDMLAVLKDLVAFFDTTGLSTEFLTAALAAIAKAEGSTPQP